MLGTRQRMPGPLARGAAVLEIDTPEQLALLEQPEMVGRHTTLLYQGE